jgi:hypothetical protein
MIYRIALSLSVVLAALGVGGGIVYLVSGLGRAGIFFALAVTAVVAVFSVAAIFKKTPATIGFDDLNTADREPPRKIWALGLVPLILLASACFILLYRGQTDAALNSPWKNVSPLFWISLVLAAINGVALAFAAGKNTAFLATLILWGVAASVATQIYQIGYGYDPFVHEAAMEHIAAYGTIDPKTVYYAGQYAIIVVLHAITGIAIHHLNVYLVPALFAITAAGTVAYAAEKARFKNGYFAAAGLAFFPLAFFINTTPFGLSALFCLAAATLGVGVKNDRRLLFLVWLFAVAALLTHPIAGVPAVTLALLLQFKNPLIKFFAALFGAASLPVLFAVAGAGFSFSWPDLAKLTMPFETPLTRFAALGDTVYLTGIIIAILVIIATVAANRTYLLAGLSAAMAGLLVSATIDFSYLPDGEQSWYSARLFSVALLIMAPMAAAAAGRLIERSRGRILPTLQTLALIVFFFTSAIYLAYPREDAYVISKGWTTSQTDIAAVHAIMNDAQGADYIVLSAQPVSAAALKEFGFFKYYDTPQGKIFAYPVPIGGELYKFYLKMIYEEPSSEYMREAMELAGVKKSYFVVSSYWTGSAHAISRAKQTADKWFAINEADYIFYYTRD